MKFSEVFISKDKIQLDKRTLIILRWLAIVGQYFTISVVYFVLNFELPFFYCSLIIFIGIITNLYLQFKVKDNQLNNFTSTIFLFYDLLQLARHRMKLHRVGQYRMLDRDSWLCPI